MLKTSLLLLSLIKTLQSLQTCSLLLGFNFKELDCIGMKSPNKKTTMVITYKIQMKEILLGPDLRVYKKKYTFHNLIKKEFSINIKNQPNAECFSSAVIKIREKNNISEKAPLIFENLYDVDYLNNYVFRRKEVKEKEMKILLKNIECEGRFPFFGQNDPEYFYSISKDLKGEEFGEKESLVINLESNYVKRFERNEEMKFMENFKSPFLDENNISFVIENNGDSLKRQLPRKKKKNNKNKKIRFFDQVEVNVFKLKTKSEEELSEDENFDIENFAIGGAGIKEKINEGTFLGTYETNLKEENPMAFINKKNFVENRKNLKDTYDKLDKIIIGKKEAERVYI